MTVFLRWLLLPIIGLIALLFWKGSPILIKSLLLIFPLVLIIAWFVHEGAFSSGGGLTTIYSVLAIISFLVCYEIGLLIHRFYLIKKGVTTNEDDILLLIGLVILVIATIYFFISISK